MSPVLLILFAWGALDVVFVGAIAYLGRRSARKRRAPRAEAGRRRLGVGEPSVPAPRH